MRMGTPMWTVGPRVLENTLFVIMILALSVEFLRVVSDGNPAGGWVSLLLSAAGVASIRKFPPFALVGISAGPIAGALLGWDPITTWSVACFAALILALRGLPAVLTGVVVSVAVLTASGVAGGSIVPSVNPGASIGAFAALVTTTAGSSIRAHRKYWFELERRTHDAVSTRAAAVDRAIAEERVNIARDLHDSVGHHIAVVSMHLGSAEVHLPSGADAARIDLDKARAGVQAVLRETQQILTVLRVDGESDSSAPTADHHRITELVATYRAAGMEIESSVPEEDREMSPSASAAAFRIVQESLTNAHRHGAGAVSLTITVPDEGEVVIEIVNVRSRNGSSGTTGGGRGLVGMRERATSIGGTLDAKAEGELFWVRATLPLDGRPAR